MGSNWEPLSETIKHVNLTKNMQIIYPRLKAMARAEDIANETARNINLGDKERNNASELSDKIQKLFNETVLMGI